MIYTVALIYNLQSHSTILFYVGGFQNKDHISHKPSDLLWYDIGLILLLCGICFLFVLREEDSHFVSFFFSF